MRQTYLHSLQKSLRDILARDPLAYVLGEDILDPYGGSFKVTQGLSSAYPEQVIATPISEATIVGLAGGMALRGLHPIVEIMFGDFLALAADQIVNHIAKYTPMYGNQNQVPLVIRTPMGSGRGYGPTHSQSLEKLFLGIPNLRVVAPSQFHDPGLLLERAVNLGNPVLFIEHKLLYPSPLTLAVEEPYAMWQPEEGETFPTVCVTNNRARPPDVTLISYGGMGLLAQKVLERMTLEEVQVLLCLPSQLHPSPNGALTEAARATGRVVIIEEDTRSFGWGAEIAAMLGKPCGAVLRVTALPNAHPLEAE